MKLLGINIAVMVFLVTAEALDRCLYTHKDKPCVATGKLPLTLKCRYPGRWFEVKETELLKDTGEWEPLNNTKTAEKQCKDSKVTATSRGYKCEVHDLGTKLGSQVRVTYHCWEFDQSILGGFGKK